MSTFFATLVYELDPSTEADARKLLRAEMVGRRWQDRADGRPLPGTALWIRRAAGPSETTDDVHRACGEDLLSSIAAVERGGRRVTLRRAWVQVAGAGTYGLLAVPPKAEG
jgi:hypothetical protein